jgi:hypothetical protein
MKRNPQVELPTMMVSKLKPPATGTGTAEDEVAPLPSSPEVPLPQQNARESTVTPQAWLPAVIDVKLSPPETATGARRFS